MAVLTASAGDAALYVKCLIEPAGHTDLQAITIEKDNMERIVAMLGLKEMTQGTPIRKQAHCMKKVRGEQRPGA